VVSTWRIAVDLNGELNGTAYLGGWHGFSAFHGIDADCGCIAFEEHMHWFSPTIIAGADVRGVAITSMGDVLTGDRDFVSLLPQRSKGTLTGLFDYLFAWGLDVFPGVRDENVGVALDAQDGAYVASDGNGLAYLAPGTQAAEYWSSSTTLPQNHLRGVAVDGSGDVWVATASAGLARFHPSTGAWTYYTDASGLPASTMHAVYFDKLHAGGKIYVATANGVGILTP
jgi:hypothetical protein